MQEIELKLNKFDQGVFVIEENHELKAELRFVFINKKVIAYHTEVSEEYRGQGLAQKLLGRLVDQARENKMKIIPLCPFISKIFAKDAEAYKDVWEQGGAAAPDEKDKTVTEKP